MIMSEKDFKIICVTNRRLCRENFMLRLRKIAAARPDAIMLREKDLPPVVYRDLARRVQEICRFYGVSCIWHTYFAAETEFLHLPRPLWQQYNLSPGVPLPALGVSCHSLAEAVAAAAGGCAWLTAGHIFMTDCKPGLPARGLDFLRQICRAEDVNIPVYAIGGVKPENIAQVKAAGAQGACVMSGFMRCAEPAALLAALRAN